MRWLIIDGFGFHEAYFKTKQYVHQKKLPKLSPFATHVFYQGVGRCLWFVCGTDALEIKHTVSSFDEIYHKDLWAGIGLACVYAGEVKMEDLIQLKTYAGVYLPNLLQGAAFAAKARERAGLVTEYTKAAVSTLTGLTVRKAAAVTDNAMALIPAGMPAQKQYEIWKNTISEMLMFK